MKIIINVFAVLVVMNACGCGGSQNAYREHGPYRQETAVSFQLFYDELSPYGSWVDYPNYGYVWIPSEDQDFAPYRTRGHWVLTDAGWTWASDSPWGWAA